MCECNSLAICVEILAWVEAREGKRRGGRVTSGPNESTVDISDAPRRVLELVNVGHNMSLRATA